MSNTLFRQSRVGEGHAAGIKLKSIQGYNIQDIAKRLKEVKNIKDYLIDGDIDGPRGLFLNFAKLMETDKAKNNNSDDKEISKALAEAKREDGIYKLYGASIFDDSKSPNKYTTGSDESELTKEDNPNAVGISFEDGELIDGEYWVTGETTSIEDPEGDSTANAKNASAGFNEQYKNIMELFKQLLQSFMKE